MENPENLSGVVPPHSIEAEISVLGAMLQDSTAVLRAMELLNPEDFYLPEHREIFTVMTELNRNHTPIDLVTMHTELARRGTLEGIGGTDHLMRILDQVPTTANAKAYIDIVREKSTLRKLIGACQKISGECYRQQNPVPETLAAAEKAIFDIVMNRADGEALQPLGEVAVRSIDIIEELARNRGSIAGVPTGFTDLDNLLTGLHAGELIILGARPAMGKTSFAMNVAAHASINKGKKVAVFTLEMPREQIAMRVLCSDARVDMQRVRKGTLTNEDWVKLSQSLTPMVAAPMYIDDTSALSPIMLRSRCRRLMMDKGLDLIALELKVPVMACAQLSRANKDRQDKRPVLSDLRDSGSIEQDADVVMFLHREDYYNKDTEDKNIAEVIIAKQRSGPLGTVKLAWLSETTTFANLARDDTPGGPAPW